MKANEQSPEHSDFIIDKARQATATYVDEVMNDIFSDVDDKDSIRNSIAHHLVLAYFKGAGNTLENCYRTFGRLFWEK